jgi:uncharacterized protein YbjT (DUF2867 family)
MTRPDRLILVTGATGYIGRQLIPRLLMNGYRVRCLSRDAVRIKYNWISQVELVTGDILDQETLKRALEGVSTAYYLIHSMASGRDYAEKDLSAAQNFAVAASHAGLEKIIYLGGLADPDSQIGSHMLSRIQTGQALRQGKVPVIEFRASVIIGPGSISFEMIRYLTEQFPVLVGPRWFYNLTQPIAIQNVLDYLLAALEHPATQSQVYEIGGPDLMTYAETMLVYARLRGLKRKLLTLPMVPLGLMAFFVDKLTPVPSSIASPLIDSMRGDSVAHSDAARRDFPQVRLLDYQAAVTAALGRLSPEYIEPALYDGAQSVIIIKDEGFFIDHCRTSLELKPEVVYSTFIGLGGKRGWLYLNKLWQLRGWLDRLLGGPGMRGRQDDNELQPGAIVDFYRVDALEPGRMLRLRSDLKAPGAGWMEWRVLPQSEGNVLLLQTAFFAPKGITGFLYWYLFYPLHRLIFAGLLKAIAHRAHEIQRASSNQATCIERKFPDEN